MKGIDRKPSCGRNKGIALKVMTEIKGIALKNEKEGVK